MNYGAEPRVYEDVYRSWIKTVARDMESFARHQGLNVLLNKLEADQIRDGLTGMYNFRGFMGRANDMIVQAAEEKSEILVLAVDLKNTRQINSNYGRTEGDRVLSYVAQSINEILTPYEISMRMGNDEFVIATVAKSGDISRGEYIAEELKKKSLRRQTVAERTITSSVYITDVRRLWSSHLPSWRPSSTMRSTRRTA